MTNPYFKSNRPPIPSMSNLIIPSALPYDLQISVMFHTQTGKTEIRLSALTPALKQINLLQVAGILSEHVSNLMRQLCSGKGIEVVPVTIDENAGGGNNGEQPKA